MIKYLRSVVRGFADKKARKAMRELATQEKIYANAGRRIRRLRKKLAFINKIKGMAEYQEKNAALVKPEEK